MPAHTNSGSRSRFLGKYIKEQKEALISYNDKRRADADEFWSNDPINNAICLEILPKESKTQLSGYLKRLEGMIPSRDDTSIVIDFSKEAPPNINHNGHSFSPSTAMCEFTDKDDADPNTNESVPCRTNFLIPVEGTDDTEYEIYSTSDTAIKSESGYLPNVSYPISLVVTDSSNTSSQPQKVRAMTREHTIGLVDETTFGRGIEIWDMKDPAKTEQQSQRSRTGRWEPAMGSLTVFVPAKDQRAL